MSEILALAIRRNFACWRFEGFLSRARFAKGGFTELLYQRLFSDHADYYMIIDQEDFYHGSYENSRNPIPDRQGRADPANCLNRSLTVAARSNFFLTFAQAFDGIGEPF